MPILARYLFRLFLPAFLLCLGVCTAVLLMNHFLRLFSLAVLKGISPAWILSCFARLLPYFFSLAIPMAFLVALLLTLGHLSETGEVMALRSSGFSFKDILWPFFSLAVAASLLLLYVNHKASPEGFHSFKNSYEDALRQVSRVDVEPRTFVALGDWRLYAQEVDSATGRLGGVYLVKLKGGNKGLRVDAPEGKVEVRSGEGLSLELYRGAMQLPEAQPDKFVSASFARYRLFVPFAGPGVAARKPDLQELNTFRLRERLRDPDTDLEHRKEYATEAALRSAGALTPFVFFWVGCPLGLKLAKGARATGFGLSLLVMFLYYGLLALGVGLGRRHLVLSPFAPWLPDLGGLAAGAFFWTRNLRG